MSTGIAPNQLTLRAYQVGFGDCFLLTFHYPQPGKPRHVLIDFGSSEAPKVYGSTLMKRVANDISAECGQKLHAVVATHRHSDHISGFAQAKGGEGPGDVIRACKPEVVLMPWTEDPKAACDAPTPTQELPPTQAYLRGLSAMQMFSEAMLNEVQLLGGRIPKGVRKQLSFLGETNLKNLSAVRNLMTMGKRKPRYLSFGVSPGLDTILPGVRIHVLGPPTLRQWDKIRKQATTNEAEFWQFQALASKRFVSSQKAVFEGPVAHTRPPYTRWMIPRLQASRGDQLLELVRILDSALNNTSLILLFEVGSKKFLFPGDAQIENWSYALDQANKSPRLKALLKDVFLYKVGHHGSLNATPKSLWALFARRSKTKSQDRLWSVLSTMAGKHGDEAKSTEVPRRTLVEALTAESDCFSTQTLRMKRELKEVFTLKI